MHACKLSRFSCVQLFGILWTVACQAPLSMGFSRQEHWIVLPCPPPRDLPDLGIKPASPVAPALQADSLLLSHQGSPNTGDLSSIPGQGTSSHVPQLIPARATPTQKKKKKPTNLTPRSHTAVFPQDSAPGQSQASLLQGEDISWRVSGKVLQEVLLWNSSGNETCHWEQ